MPAEESETPAVEPGDSEAAAPSVDLETLALKIDPVCKMTLEGIPIVGTAEHEGKTYGFCAALCKKKFEEDPAAMLARLAPKPEGRRDK
ncbi:MAG: YHS domain-containing protein [Candidatus Hydrogenedentes bacterium]|nr:YHS domain-containing protein [Candidatus Hydrogenedentota bacterium]